MDRDALEENGEEERYSPDCYEDDNCLADQVKSRAAEYASVEEENAELCECDGQDVNRLEYAERLIEATISQMF